MNICIIGCGAIGGIYGAHLASQPGISVWAYDPDDELVKAVNAEGIRLQGIRDLQARVVATTDPASIPSCEFGIIATKSFHTRSAIGTTKEIFKQGALCSLQNGIGNEETLALEIKQVLSGSTLVGGHITSPGVIEFDTDGLTLIGPAETGAATMQQAQELAMLLSKAGLETQAVDDPRGVKWSKLIFNSSANMVCALTRLPFYAMYRQTGLRELTQGLAREGMAVADALGISLAFDPIEKLEALYEQAINHVPSTLTDIQHGRKTEIDVLNAAIVAKAESVGISCPLNSAVTSLIRGLETNQV
jgi:2-dehydropantoate 2-reductase